MNQTRSPRLLQPNVEGLLRKRADGVWGVERKLRWIVTRYPDASWEWADVLSCWVDRHQNPPKVWDVVEVVLLDWLLDPALGDDTRKTIREIFDAIPDWRDNKTS